jgi:hypothetical protein
MLQYFKKSSQNQYFKKSSQNHVCSTPKVKRVATTINLKFIFDAEIHKKTSATICT